jgi:hypothetical protein
MDEYCNNYGLLILNKKATSSNLKDKVFWGKSTLIHEPFTVGSREYWAIDELFRKDDVGGNVNWAQYKQELRQAQNVHQIVQDTSVVSMFQRLDENGNPFTE